MAFTANTLLLLSAVLSTVAALPPASLCVTQPIQCCTNLVAANTPDLSELFNNGPIPPKCPYEDAGLSCVDIVGTIGPGGNASCPTGPLGLSLTAVCCGQKDNEFNTDCVAVDPLA